MGKCVVVIGGGFSGLSSAVKLSESGFDVILVEKNSYLGGRAYSFVENKTGCEIDNGQHLILGCYKNTFEFLKKINSDLKIPTKLVLPFLLNGKKYIFRTNLLPAPLNFVFGLIRFKLLSFKDKINIIKIIIAIFKNEKDIGQITVSEWLTKHNQSINIQKYFWNIIAIGALNDLPERTSAKIFKMVLKEVMFFSNKNSSFVIAEKPLSKIFSDKAEIFLKNNNCKIIINQIVDEITQVKNSKFAIKLKNQNKIIADAVVLATPHDATFKFLTKLKIHNMLVNKDNYEVLHSAIVNIHLWFSKSFFKEEFIAILDSPIHWIFNKSGIDRSGNFYISITISSANEYLNMKNENLLKMVLVELKKSFSKFIESELLHYKIIKEKRATMEQSNINQQYRLSSKTKISNLFLAGDWTNTGLPATIESAILSGFESAKLVNQFFKTGK